MSCDTSLTISCLSRSREFQDARPYEVPDLLELQTSCGPVEPRCKSIASLVVKPFGLRKLQGILQRTLLAVERDQHRQIPLIHRNVASTEVGQQGFGCL
jgi:hypothetical protein